MKRMIVCFLIMSIIFLVGCKENEFADKVTIKVLYYDKESFFNTYGNLFTAKYPNISLEVIPLNQYYKEGLSDDKYEQLIKAEKPDVVFNFNLAKSVEEGILINLEPYIKNSNLVKLEKMNPNIISYLRQKGDGSIYALSPTFQAKALFFNKQLFDEFGIEYPRDFMSWEDVILLASRFSKAQKNNQKVYGYFQNAQHPYSLVSEIANTQNVSYSDNEGKHVQINTDSWKKIFEIVIKNYKENSISTNNKNAAEQGNSLKENPFTQGNAAMMVDYSYQIRYLSEVKFDWQIVTEPVNPAMPNESNSLDPNQLFGINAESSNKEAAWKLIEYINSDEFSKINAKSGGQGSLTVYLENQNVNNINLEAFYKLRPQDSYTPSLPLGFILKYPTMAENAMTNVLNGQQDLESMLNELNKNAQFELEQSIKNEAEKSNEKQ